MEIQFFHSAQHFANLYGIKLLDITQDSFPFNMYSVFMQVCAELKLLDPDTHPVIIKDEQRKGCLATIQILSTGRTLYYIPVSKLFSLTTTKADQRRKVVLLSVFAYLYQIVRVPFYTEMGTAMNRYYSTIWEWTQENQDEWEAAPLRQFNRQYKKVMKKGEQLRCTISDPIHLQEFEDRLKRLPNDNKTGNTLQQIADQVYQLYKDFPTRSFYDNIHPSLMMEQDDYDDDQLIDVDEYLSFYWGEDDDLHQQLIEYIDSCLNERGQTLEPIAIQYFDTPQATLTHDFTFERRLLDLLNQLTDFLNNELP